MQDAHGGLSLFNEANSAIAVPLVLDGDAADLNHHIPELLGGAPTFFRTWKLLTRGCQELTKLSGQNRTNLIKKNAKILATARHTYGICFKILHHLVLETSHCNLLEIPQYLNITKSILRENTISQTFMCLGGKILSGSGTTTYF